jgi:hypothetical protein
MAYNYITQRPFVFTEEGQVDFLKIRDNAKKLISKAGAATMEKIMLVTSGDVWNQMACVDRLVELGELQEIKNTISSAGQHRLFIQPIYLE